MHGTMSLKFINAYLLTVKDEIQALTLSSHNGVIIGRLLEHLFLSLQLFTLSLNIIFTLLSSNRPYSKGMQ